MEEQQLVGFENLLGRKILEDPRIKEAEAKIRVAVDEYEALLLALAVEHNLIKDGGTQ